MDIEAVAHIEIGTWPTPVRRLDHTSKVLGAEVWAKVEEDCGAWGGNKVRKLEYLLHEARSDGVTKLVAWGVGTSNWAAAVAWHGTREGFEVTAGLGGHLPDSYRCLYNESGTKVTLLPRVELATVAAAYERARAGLHARLLPVGGSGGIGDIGATRCGIEIARQVQDGELPPPDTVFVAAGSCGTVAGVVVGLESSASTIPVTAVKVADWPYATPWMIARRIANIRRRLARPASGPERLHLERRFLGPGYGHPTPESRAATTLAHHDGLDLDGSYGAKAFAALCDAARSGDGPYLFVHTSPGEPPTG
jgi:D-cysteine desulfhydrase